MSNLRNSRVGRVCAPMTTDFITRPVADPAPGQVLIKVVSSAICGSDLHIFKDKHPSVALPATIGHEFSGDVAAIGEGVTAVRVGDRVTVEPCIVCGKCDACKEGNYGYCEQISFTYRNGDGAMADYVTVREPYVYHLPDSLSYDAGALVEPLAVAVHAVRRGEVKLGEKVLVIGAGAIGMLTAAVCRRCGAEVAISDYSPHRLKLAAELGASVTINPGEQDFDAAVRDFTQGKGVDKAFECVGLQDTLVQAMLSLKKSGLATVVGIFEKPEVNIPASRFVTHEIRVQGAQGYCRDFPVAIQLAQEIGLERLATHAFSLDDLQQALETCLDRNSGCVKAILHP